MPMTPEKIVIRALAGAAIAAALSLAAGCQTSHEGSVPLLGAPAERGTQPEASGPDEARRWRLLAMRDEHGRVTDPQFQAARTQRLANLAAWAARPGGLADPTPGARAGLADAGWVEHGPNNVGGRTRSLLIDPDDPQHWIAGSVSGGLWRSVDGGATWTPVDDRLPNLAVGCLAMDPADHDVLYAGTGEGFFNGDAIGGNGLYRSLDRGVTWSIMPGTESLGNICRIAISPANADVILLATRYGGIRRTTNGGTTWQTPLGAQGAFDVDFAPDDPSRAIAHVIDYDFDAGTWYHRAAFSTDGGASWQTATGLSYEPGFGARIEVGYAPSDSSIVYASVAIDGGVVYRSDDGGQSYTLVTTSGGSGCNWYANPLWIDPTDPDVLLVGGYHVHRSTDGGATLEQISSGYIMTDQPHPDIHNFITHPDYDGTANRTVIVLNDGGMWRTDDVYDASPRGGWTRTEQSYRTTQFYGAAGHDASGVIIGGTQDNGTLRVFLDDDEANLTFGGDGGFCAVDQDDPSFTYGEYVRLQIHRSTNGGASASYIFGGIGDAGSDANFIAPFILDPNDPNVMLAGGRSLWRSTDVRAETPTWTAIRGAGSSNISAIAVAPGDSGIIWVGQNNGEIHATTTGTLIAPPWHVIDDNGGMNPLPDRYITRILIDPDDADVAYVALGGFAPDNLWRTTDAGVSWTEITGTGVTGLPDAPIRGIARHPVHADRLYVGTELGVFASADGGGTWSTSLFGPANVSVDEVVFMHDSQRLLAATHGRGLWTIDLTSVVGDLNGDGIVDASDLAALLASWGPCPGCPGDLDADGIIGAADLAILLANWG